MQDVYMDFFRKSICLGKKLRMIARQNLEKEGYSFNEFDVLRMLEPNEKYQISMLAKRAVHKKSNIVPIINYFEEKCFIERKRDSKDRRIVWITLTKNGELERERLINNQKEYIKTILKSFDYNVIEEMNSKYDIVLDSLKETYPEAFLGHNKHNKGGQHDQT